MKTAKSNAARRYNKRIVICGSMSSHSQMLEQIRILRRQGVPSIAPDADTDPHFILTEEAAQESKRRASMRHIRRIRDRNTFGILVMNLDKHGIYNYVGPNAFAEIAIAFAHYKRIFLYQGIPDFYREELVAWQAVPLFGKLSQLINEYQLDRLENMAQLDMFDLLDPQ